MSHIRSSLVKFRLPILLVAVLATSSYAALVVYKTTRPFVSTKFNLDSSDEPVKQIATFAPAEAVATAIVPAGAKLTVFAAEPHVSRPIAIAFDARGRLWVAECRSYQYAVDGAPPAEAVDRIIVLEDLDHDGCHDRRTVFAEGLKNLSGLELGWGGVWACCAPELLFIPDADRDLRPDGKPVVVLDGFDGRPELSRHLPNHLLWGPDGKLYGCSGYSSRSLPAKPGTPKEKRTALDAGVWRVDPQTHEFEVVARGTCDPWGIDFDSAGRLFVSNDVVDHLWQIRSGGHYGRRNDPLKPRVYEALDPCVDPGDPAGADPREQGRSEKVGGGGAHGGLLIYQGGDWIDAYREMILIGNVHGGRICADRFDHSSGLPVARRDVDLLRMADPGFRCVDIKSGPDGQVYFCDWSSLGDTQTLEAEAGGRLYKLTFPDVSSAKFDLAEESAEELLRRQGDRNDWFVRQARTQLHYAASQGKVGAPVADQAWTEACDRKRSTSDRLRSLWTWSLIVPRARRNEVLALTDDRDPIIRGWALRIGVEGDAASSKVSAALIDAAKRFDEPEFVAEAASLAGRLPPPARREVLAVLLPKLHDGLPRDQQRLAWYALQPILLDDLTWSTEQALQLRGGFLANAVARRFAEAWATQDPTVDQAALADSVQRILSAQATPNLVVARIHGLRDGIAGSDRAAPEAWRSALQKSAESPEEEVRAAAKSLPW